MQRSCIPRPHVTRVQPFTCTKMAVKRLYINGGGEKGRGIRRENEKSGANI